MVVYKPIPASAVKNNATATTDPGVTNDSSEGYAVNSIWINTVSGEAYRCIDATEGAAVWPLTTLTADELHAVAISGDKADIGLGNVDNTSDANKPVSTAQQAALDLKSDTSHNHTGVYAPISHTHVAADITDFDTEVSNNAAVAANTAKVGVTVEEANPDVISQAEAEAGTATTERIFTAQRVAQAIAALAGGGGSPTAMDPDQTISTWLTTQLNIHSDYIWASSGDNFNQRGPFTRISWSGGDRYAVFELPNRCGRTMNDGKLDGTEVKEAMLSFKGDFDWDSGPRAVGFLPSGNRQSIATYAASQGHSKIAFVIDNYNVYAVTDDGTTRTMTDLTSLSINQTHHYTIHYNYNGGSPEVKFYVDGTLEATHTTNIPTDNDEIGLGAGGNAGMYLSHLQIAIKDDN